MSAASTQPLHEQVADLIKHARYHATFASDLRSVIEEWSHHDSAERLIGDLKAELAKLEGEDGE